MKNLTTEQIEKQAEEYAKSVWPNGNELELKLVKLGYIGACNRIAVDEIDEYRNAKIPFSENVFKS